METIKVSNGYVQGQKKTILGKDIVEFLSIPYCRAPINDLRFKKPQVPTFVDGVINHSEFKTCPPQKFFKIFENNQDEQLWIPTEEQSEDCLYLNIWCPCNKLKSGEAYSVLVWIYGGGFVSGSSSLPIYNGSVLAAMQNIIVISLNYRIGLLGFLCLDDEINGNQGIWDQLMALKWIYENIANFHGNPCNITLGGNSAGACSVTLHLIIEESWNYYSKILVQSGVCLSDWAFLPKGEIVAKSEKMVNYLLEKSDASLRWNVSLTKSEKDNILKILQNIDFHQFLNDPYLEGFLNFGWTPCIDGSLIKVNLETLFRSKKFKNCPSIFLNVENEGTYFLLYAFSDFVVDDSNCVDEKYFNECFKYYPFYPTLSPSTLKAKIINEYNFNLSQMSINTLDKIISDRHFVCDSIRLANYVSEKSEKTYYLWFNTHATKTEWPEWVGIMHSEEIYYLFGHNILQDDEMFDKCSIKYMDNIGHFIKHGSLPHGLPVYENGTKNYILIENDQWKVLTFSEDQMHKVKFWEELRL